MIYRNVRVVYARGISRYVTNPFLKQDPKRRHFRWGDLLAKLEDLNGLMKCATVIISNLFAIDWVIAKGNVSILGGRNRLISREP